MRELDTTELEMTFGGSWSLWGNFTQGVSVVWGAMTGDAPGSDVLTGTASGPTPGGAGGRYREEDAHKERSMDNVPGGQVGRSIMEIFQGGNEIDELQ